MLAKEIVTKTVKPVNCDTSLTETVRRMESAEVAMLPVSQRDEIIGIITKRQILRRVLVEGSDPVRTMVGEIMTPEVVCCSEDTDVRNLAEIIEKRGDSCLVVIGVDRSAVGMVTKSELAVLVPTVRGAAPRKVKLSQ